MLRNWMRYAVRVVIFTCSAAALILPLAGAKAVTNNGNYGEGLAKLAPKLPVVSCASLEGQVFNVSDDETSVAVVITQASVAPAGTNIGGGTPSLAPVCSVTGQFAAAPLASATAIDTFAMVLPTDGWTQRYVQNGCGGLCGNVNTPWTPSAVGQSSVNPYGTCPAVKDDSLALAATDMGYLGNQNQTLANNPQAQLDFAYLSQHRLSIVAKAVINRFYGQHPKYSYFDGCSDGGREALMEAERYPNDFDGIAAGAPVQNLTVQNTFHHAWPIYINQSPKGSDNFIVYGCSGSGPNTSCPILNLVHQASVKACDALDGVTDGIIDNPRICNFNPHTLVCASGVIPNPSSPTCLTSAQADVIQSWHDGASVDGVYLEQYGSREWGSELDWTLFFPTQNGVAGLNGAFANSIVTQYVEWGLAYINYDPNPWNINQLQFTIPNFFETVKTSAYLSSTNPDLHRFNDRGGKLLIWHGFADQHVDPQGTIEFYENVRETMGPRAAEDFVRLFLFPGVAHCGQGLGPNIFDVLTPVMQWVEGGVEPEKIVANNTSTNVSRPVYPYPLQAKYKGTGSTSDDQNFEPTPSAAPLHDYRNLGEFLYSPHFPQVKCKVNGTQLECPTINAPPNLARNP